MSIATKQILTLVTILKALCQSHAWGVIPYGYPHEFYEHSNEQLKQQYELYKDRMESIHEHHHDMDEHFHENYNDFHYKLQEGAEDHHELFEQDREKTHGTRRRSVITRAVDILLTEEDAKSFLHHKLRV